LNPEYALEGFCHGILESLEEETGHSVTSVVAEGDIN